MMIQRRMRSRILAIIAVLIANFYFLNVSGIAADKPSEDVEELSRKAENPIANMISLPLQYNVTVGGAAGTIRAFSLQPIIPIRINKEWNLITRTVIPLVSASPKSVGKRVSGVGDSTVSLYLSPRESGATFWGIGPIVQLPTSNNPLYGTKTFGVGPTAAVIKMEKRWVYGGLVSYLGSTGKSSSGRYTSLLAIQPIVNYFLPHRRGMSLSFAPGIICDYTRPSGERWIVPIGMGVSQIMKIGGQQTNVSFGAYYNIVRPMNAPVWNYRFQVTFLFPK